jgi:centractin
MADTLHNAPIVLDNGSGTIRAGFAGEDLPKCYFPSFVGRPKHLRVLAGALEGDVFIGQRAQELRGLLRIRYPLEHGIVTDWDDMERIWQHVYTEELKTLSEEVGILNFPCKILLARSIEQQLEAEGRTLLKKFSGHLD